MKKRLGEFELISLLTNRAPKKAAGLVRGIGDDCAITRHGLSDVLTTTDMLVEGVHFHRRWCDAKELGWKSLAVNISDIAAMGGCPKFYFVSIAVPKNCDELFLVKFYEGMRACGGKYGCALAGGDTVSSDKALVVSITVIGEAARGKALRRDGATDGDVIFCTGRFGGAAAGLAALKRSSAGKHPRRFLSRLHLPVPRVFEGLWLARTGLVTSAIDVSDGLVADLSHIADESDVGFIVDASSVPFETGLFHAAKKFGLNPLDFALAGGEDYELIFTIKKNCLKKFESLADRSKFKRAFTKIGVMVGDKRTRVCIDRCGKLVRLPSGFNHFKD